MARKPKTIYQLTDGEVLAVADLVGTIDAAMLTWDPLEQQHVFTLAAGTNARVVHQLKKEYVAVGWEVALAFKEGVTPPVPLLVFKDPNYAENVATLP